MEEKITDCCSEPFIEESDVCSRCKEHAGCSLATEYGEDGLPEGISIFDGTYVKPRKDSVKIEKMEKIEIKGYEEFEPIKSDMPPAKKVLIVKSLKESNNTIYYFKKIEGKK